MTDFTEFVSPYAPRRKLMMAKRRPSPPPSQRRATAKGGRRRGGERARGWPKIACVDERLDSKSEEVFKHGPGTYP